MAESDKNDRPQGAQEEHASAAENFPGAEGMDNDALLADVASGDSALAQAQAEAQQLKDQLLRTLADLDNTRKRAERDVQQARKFAITDFARDLLSAADNLRRALDSAPENRAQLDATVRNLIVGVEMTEKELLGAFEKHGVRKVDPLGEKFDYNLHQAMFEVVDPNKEPGTVVQVMQPGYVLQDRLLRAAMVGVSKADDKRGQQPLDTTA